MALFSAVHSVSAATDTWTGSTDTNWATAGNWTGGNAPPVAGDALVFNSGSPTTLFNNFTAGTAFDGLYYNGPSAFTQNGNNVLLSGAISNTVGIFNNSGATQTFGTLSLTLDWGYYTISSSSGTIALNGGLTPNAGGVAYFDANVTSTTLTTDGAGLISGLGGAGLMFSGTGTPTGLATISGGSIIAYPNGSYTSYNSGAIATGANNNVLLNTSTNVTFTSANGVSVNTITANQAGDAAGNSTTTLTVTGTLTLGATSGIGGIYALDGGNGGTYASLLTVSAGTGAVITAGPSGVGGTIVIGATDTTAANLAPNAITQSVAIQDNNGGKVSVIKVGNSSSTLGSSTNTFSGGLYVDQGQIQSGTLFGTGQVYVAPGATLFINNSSALTFTNNFFITPGTGTSLQNASGSQGAMKPGAILWGTTGNASFNSGNAGTITLLGAPVSISAATPAAGDRFTGNGTTTGFFNGAITGTGTLDLCAVPHACTYEWQNQSATATNNWSGGLIIETPLSDPSSARTVVAMLGGAQQYTQIPHGNNAGNVLLYSGANSGSFVTGSSATLNLNGLNATINGLYGYSAAGVSGNIIITNGSSTGCTLTLGDGNANGNYGGVINDRVTNALGLVKIGTGAQTFTAALNYHGNTTVSNGSFLLSGSAALVNSTNINIAAPGTLDATATSGGGLTLGSSQILNGIGTLNGATIINGTVQPFLGSIGTLTNNGSVTLNSGGTYLWDINNATNTAGSDPGWSLLNISGGLQINSTTNSPFNIDIASLTSGDVAGNAAFNVNANGHWVIAETTSGISGFTGSGQFNIVTSAFSNAPSSSSQWTVSVSGNNLVLNYAAFNVITTSPADSTNNASSTATFTAGSTTGIQPVTYTWYQNGNLLVNTGGSAGGGTVSIMTNGAGTSSTMSIAGVQDADTVGDISVTISDSASHSASANATLTVIDAPYSPNVTQSGASFEANLGGYSGGGRTYLSATANGGIDGVTPDFNYQWYLGTNLIMGATNDVLAVNVSGAAAGNYTVVISNPAGSVTSSATTISPVTSVPGQIIYEPFDSYANNGTAGGGSLNDTFSGAAGFTNVFDQLTGEPSYWTVEGAPPKYSGVNINGMAGASGSTGENQFGGEYPWPGLAGDSPNEFYWTGSTTDTRLRVTTNGSSLFAVGGPNTNIFFSFTMSIVSLGSGAFDGTQSVMAGFTSSAGTSACGLEFWTWVVSGGAGQMFVGVGKGNGTTVNNPTTNNGNSITLPNVAWGSGFTPPNDSSVWVQQAIFVVGCYSVVDGPGHSNDMVTLWINPASNSYYAQVPPTPYLGPTNFGGTVANSTMEDFVLLEDYAPASHRITDLRIGTTWASVTPPSGPTLLLGNVYAPVGTTPVLASQNAGNPVTGGYGWQFNGGPALSDGATGHGSSISGSLTGTLTISNIQPADYGLYTVNGTNTDLSPVHSGNLVGSTTAIVSGEPPSLKAVLSGPDVIIQWPTNWLGYVLEQTPSVSPVSWTTNSLPPYAVSGTNNEVVVPASGAEFYRLINP